MPTTLCTFGCQITSPPNSDPLPMLPEPEATALKTHLKQVTFLKYLLIFLVFIHREMTRHPLFLLTDILKCNCSLYQNLQIMSSYKSLE